MSARFVTCALVLTLLAIISLLSLINAAGQFVPTEPRRGGQPADVPATRPAGAAAAARPPLKLPKLRKVSYPDGSGSVALPADWQLASAAGGFSASTGPEGQVVNCNLRITVATPESVQALIRQAQLLGAPMPSLPSFVAPYTNATQAVADLAPQFCAYALKLENRVEEFIKIIEATPAPSSIGDGALVHALTRRQVNGRWVEYHHLIYARVGIVDASSWAYFACSASAPADVFRRDLPLLMAIVESGTVSDRELNRAFGSAMAKLHEANDIFTATMHDFYKSQSDRNADWVEVIGDWRVIRDTRTGEERTAKLTWIKETLEDLNRPEGHDRWVEVPLRTWTGPNGQ